MNTSLEHDVAAMLARERVRRRRRPVAGALAVLIVGGIAAYRLLQPVTPAPAFLYETVAATRGPLVVTVSATGTLQPVTQVEVGTEVSGTVADVLVDFNEEVTAGQVLARLDTTQLAARERQSHAALRLAQARVEESRATERETARKLARVQSLIARQLAAAEEQDTLVAAHARARAGVEVAAAQVQQARAQLEFDRQQLEKAVVHAPIDGIVLKRQVEPGQTVAAAFQTPVLFTLAENLTQMELHVQVDEADVGKVAAGQTAEFVVDAYPDRRFPAEITLVRYVPQTVDGVVTYETVLSVDNAGLLLRPGMTVTAEILVRRFEDVLRVPNTALRFVPPSSAPPATVRSGNLVGRLLWRPPAPVRYAPETPGAGPRVWVLRDGAAVPIGVTTGATDGVLTEVAAGGLNDGAHVIVDARPSNADGS